MSVQAIAWAYQQQIEGTSRSSSSLVKFVLVTLANYAGMEGELWPSVERLAKDTQLSERSVRDAIHALFALGLVADTTVRRGRTKRVRVLQVNAGGGAGLNAGGGSALAGGNADDGAHEMRAVVPVEPLGEPLGKPTPGARESGAKANGNGHHEPDLLLAALIEATHTEPGSDRTTAGPFFAALKSLRANGATPESVRGAAAAYIRAWPTIAITPPALARHYTRFAPHHEVQTEARCPHGRKIGYFCPECSDLQEQRTIEAMTSRSLVD